MSTLDLDAICAKWLVQCGVHDYGLVEYGCQCPDGEYRAVIAGLVDEVERLRTVNAAAERLADAVEDLLFTEGDHRQHVRDAWHRYVEAYVEAADGRAAGSTGDGTDR